MNTPWRPAQLVRDALNGWLEDASGAKVLQAHPRHPAFDEVRAAALALPELLAFAVEMAERVCTGDECIPEAPACDGCRARELAQAARP